MKHETAIYDGQGRLLFERDLQRRVAQKMNGVRSPYRNLVCGFASRADREVAMDWLEDQGIDVERDRRDHAKLIDETTWPKGQHAQQK